MRPAVFVSMFFAWFFAFSQKNASDICLTAKSEIAFKNFALDSRSDEKCFQSALDLVSSKKTQSIGIELLARFMRAPGPDYRERAILELGGTNSKSAAPVLLSRGFEVINTDIKNEARLITAALISLNRPEFVLKLAVYAKRMKKMTLMKAIRDEYFFYTSGEDYARMEKLAGKAID